MYFYFSVFFLSFDLLLFRWNLLLQSHFSCLLCLAADIRFFISFHSSSFFSFLSNSILNLLPIDCDTTIKSKKIYRAYHLLSLPLYRFFSFWIRITRITRRKIRIWYQFKYFICYNRIVFYTHFCWLRGMEFVASIYAQAKPNRSNFRTTVTSTITFGSLFTVLSLKYAVCVCI